MRAESEEVQESAMQTTEALLEALSSFADQLQALFELVPGDYRHWKPDSWDGIPSEPFTAIEQICHVRDIEVAGYQVRFQRLLHEESPKLASLDGNALAAANRYATADPKKVFDEIRVARRRTVDLIGSLTQSQLARRGEFEGYGEVTVQGLIHYLCSHDQQHLAGLHWLLGKINSRTQKSELFAAHHPFRSAK
jgi:DinB family protein